MRTHQFTIRESAIPGLIAFRARILAAVPGKSLNGRIYTRELLKQTAPLYPSRGPNPRPFILDHDIEHAERVAGFISGASYGVQEALDGTPVEGLWLEAIGYMDEKLFAKMVGSKQVPGFIRGVSIGGEGEGEFTGDGVLIKKFMPAELSVTAFPGIPQAHIAQVVEIREHYLNHSDHEVKETSTFQIEEREVSLEEAEKQRVSDSRNPRKIREAPLPGPDNGINDSRPGLPTPTVRRPVQTYNTMGTTSSDGNANIQGLNPEDFIAGKPRIGGSAPVGQYAKGGYSPTATPGFGKLSKSGTGLPDQEAAPGTAAAAGAHGSRDAKAHKIKRPKTGATTTTHPGYGNLSRSGTGMDSEEEEEEEESMRDMGDQTHPKPGSSDIPGKHTDLKRTMNPSTGKPGVNPHDKNADEEEEEEHLRVRNMAKGDGDEEEEEESPEEQEEHGPSLHAPGKPKGKVSPHSADNAYDSPADTSSEEEEEEETMQIRQDDPTVGVTKAMKPGTYGGRDDDGEEEEEEDGVTIDPIRKTAGQGQHLNANPTREENQPKVLFSEAEAIQASAFSLPTNAGILQTLSRMLSPEKAKEAMNKGSVEELVKALTRPDNYISREQVAKLIEAWNRGKIPKEEKPRKIVMGKPGIGSSKDVSIPEAREYPAIAENVVKTRSITTTTPAFAGTSISTIPNSRLQEILDEERKRPYSDVSYLNAAKRAWNRAVMDLIDFR